MCARAGVRAQESALVSVPLPRSTAQLGNSCGCRRVLSAATPRPQMSQISSRAFIRVTLLLSKAATKVSHNSSNNQPPSTLSNKSSAALLLPQQQRLLLLGIHTLLHNSKHMPLLQHHSGPPAAGLLQLQPKLLCDWRNRGPYCAAPNAAPALLQCGRMHPPARSRALTVPRWMPALALHCCSGLPGLPVLRPGWLGQGRGQGSPCRAARRAGRLGDG
jgi:hypothetical protein